MLGMRWKNEMLEVGKGLSVLPREESVNSVALGSLCNLKGNFHNVS